MTMTLDQSHLHFSFQLVLGNKKHRLGAKKQIGKRKMQAKIKLEKT